MTPLTAEAKMLAKRVGFKCYAVFNMTETSTPLRTGLDPEPTNYCGQPRPGIEARVVDQNDCEVPAGVVGELMLRTDTPWALNAGYYRNPAATVDTWRNGWFHTGDAFRKDEKGDFYFFDPPPWREHFIRRSRVRGQQPPAGQGNRRHCGAKRDDRG